MSNITLPGPVLDHSDLTAGNKPISTSWRRQTIVGVAVVATIFGGGLGWASVAELSSAAIALGQVTVSSRRQAVQNLEGGIVSEISVKDGEVVQAGQVLIRLDETQAKATVDNILAQLAAFQAHEARLRAERDGADQVKFPEALMARKSDLAVADAIAGQQALFEARKISLDGQVGILETRVQQLGNQRQGAEKQLAAQDRQVTLIEDELRGLRELLAKELVPRTRVRALEREAERLRGEAGEYQGVIARSNEAIGEAKLQILQLRKTFKEEVAKELQEVQARIVDLEQKLIAARDVLDRRAMRSPMTGVVVGLAVHTVGGVVQPGRTVLEVVPEKDQLVVEAKMLPQDVDNVHVGQQADVRFPGLPSRTAPVLEGHVQTVSADAFVDERSGQPYFTVVVTVPSAELERLGEQPLMPGMQSEVLIKTGDRTALQYFMQPFTDIWAKSFREH